MYITFQNNKLTIKICTVQIKSGLVHKDVSNESDELKTGAALKLNLDSFHSDFSFFYSFFFN